MASNDDGHFFFITGGDGIYNPKDEICCGGEVKSRSEGERCCGFTQWYNADTSICCGHHVHLSKNGMV